MKKYTLNLFDYKKENGEVSTRSAFIVSVPTDNYLTFDLSEYSLEDIEMYEKELREVFETYNQGIKDEIKRLGLSSNYRYFKKDRISNSDERG